VALGILGCVGLLGTSKLSTDNLGRGNHVAKGRLDLRVLTGLQTTIWVDPKDMGLQDCEHFIDPIHNLFGGGDPWGVDVIHAGANPSTILDSLTED